MKDEFWKSIPEESKSGISLQEERRKSWEAQENYRVESRKKSAKRKKEKEKRILEQKMIDEEKYLQQQKTDRERLENRNFKEEKKLLKGKQKTIKLGKYPQRKNLISGKYERDMVSWNILDQNETEALLISKRVLDAKPFDGDFHGTDWEYSDIRRWLNEDFFMNLFSEEEQKKIRFSKIKNKDGRETIDRIFLPSAEEMMTASYGFPAHDQSAKERIAKCTDYAKKQGCLKYNFRSPYWLRDSGSTIQTAMNVGTSGYVYHLMEESVTSHSMGIRPMIRIPVSLIGGNI